MKTVDNEEKSSNLNTIKLKFYSFLFFFLPFEDSWYAADSRENCCFFQAELRKIVD